MIHATVIGNLGADAEMRVTPGGKSVCNFRIASKGREKNTEATWVRCALWGARGEKVSQYLTKGGRVAVSGTLTTSEYNGKTSLEMDVSELELLGDRPQQQSQPAPQQRQAPQSRKPVQASWDERGNTDDEIPF